MTVRMAERNVDDGDMFSVSGSPLPFVCCRCSRTAVSAADEQLLPVPFCAARHYVCRSCFLCLGSTAYCPGCAMAGSTSGGGLAAAVDSRRVTSWSGTRVPGRVNGGSGQGSGTAGAAASVDANGNGTPTSTSDACGACGRSAERRFYCRSCSGDADSLSSSRSLCQSCWQQHQLDFHVLPRLRRDAAAGAAAASTPPTSGGQPPHYQLVAPPPPSSHVPVTVDDRQRLLAAGSTTSSSVLRQIRPRLLLSAQNPSSRDDQSLSALLGGLVMQTSTSDTSAGESSSLAVSATSLSTVAGGRPAADGLIAAGLREPSARVGRLASLQAPLARQYEGWLWQALNNGGFEQATHIIDERKQQIGVSLQSTLRDMEFRLERARTVLDELYRESMRQVSVCQAATWNNVQTCSATANTTTFGLCLNGLKNFLEITRIKARNSPKEAPGIDVGRCLQIGRTSFLVLCRNFGL